MNDINDIRPSSLKHLECKSQQQMLELVQVWLDVCFHDQVKFPNALLVGPPGTGKTTVCETIAAELQVPIHVTLGQTLRTHADLNAVLSKATERSILFLDEADLLPVPVVTALMCAISSNRIFLPAGSSVASIPLPHMTFLLATTEEYGIVGPATQRFMTLRFNYYCESDLENIVANRAHNLKWQLDEAALPLIAQRSRGTPRIALKILQASRSVCRSDGRDAITLKDFERACRLMQIDSLGLDESTDKQYLRILSETNEGTQHSVLASRIGLPSKTLQTVTEPYLLRAGLIEKSRASRRYLTPKGLAHLKKESS
jgi:Holliday junction DNA helicase RuvB